MRVRSEPAGPLRCENTALDAIHPPIQPAVTVSGGLGKKSRRWKEKGERFLPFGERDRIKHGHFAAQREISSGCPRVRGQNANGREDDGDEEDRVDR